MSSKYQPFCLIWFPMCLQIANLKVIQNLHNDVITLQWRHNGRDCDSNHQPRDCLLNGLFMLTSKKTSKLRVTGLCAGISPGPVNSPHKWPVTRKMFPFDYVIMMYRNIKPNVCQRTTCCCSQTFALSLVCGLYSLWVCHVITRIFGGKPRVAGNTFKQMGVVLPSGLIPSVRHDRAWVMLYSSKRLCIILNIQKYCKQKPASYHTIYMIYILSYTIWHIRCQNITWTNGYNKVHGTFRNNKLNWLLN